MSPLALSRSTDRIYVPEVVADLLAARGFRVGRVGAADGPGALVVASEHSGIAKAGLAINPARAVHLATNLEEAAVLLHAHGLPVLPERLPRGVVRPAARPAPGALTPLRVHVGDLRVLAVESESELPRVSGPRIQRMMEAACRSVYVLGLHYGCVHLFVDKCGRYHIAAVDPRPTVAPEVAWAYASSMAQLAETWNAESERSGDAIILGADPEFALFTRDGKLLYASRYVKHRGVVGYDRQSRANRGSVFPLVEVRPNPSPSPHTLFANTERALAAARRVLPHRGALWTAGSCPFNRYPTGGHIHFSGVPLSTPLLEALDQYLAVPVMLLEQRARARRRRQKYGRLGDVRRKEHGGFEYRTLASWLVSPQATLAVLCAAKVVATEWRRLPTEGACGPRVAYEFYRSKKTRFRQLFPRLWRALMQTGTARQYAYELAYLQRAVLEEVEWNDEADLKEAWW